MENSIIGVLGGILHYNIAVSEIVLKQFKPALLVFTDDNHSKYIYTF